MTPESLYRYAKLTGRPMFYLSEPRQGRPYNCARRRSNVGGYLFAVLFAIGLALILL